MAHMRRGLLAVVILALVAAASAVASPKPLPALFAKQVRAIDAAATAPAVLLPRSLPLDATHLYPSGGPAGRHYDLEIGALKSCHGADACFVAAFSATPGRSVFGRRVTVSGATRAGFTPLSCGASCSPPQIVFIVRGIRYTIQANLKKTAKGDRSTLISAAESAISAGPR
jgi:hypothetical protein